MRKRSTPLERFNRFVVRNEGQCWGWRGYKAAKGYGRLAPPIDEPNAPVLAHRWSYLLFKGPIEPGMMVCHTCDNPTCTNPDHLYLGDAKQNARDMVERKRLVQPERVKGPKNPLSRYTATQCIEIQKLRASGLKFREIVERTGIPYGTVATMVYRKGVKEWAHD